MADNEPQTEQPQQEPETEGGNVVEAPRTSPIVWLILLALVGAGGFYGWRMMNKGDDLRISAEDAKAFQTNMKKQEQAEPTVTVVQQPQIEAAGLSNVVADTGRGAEDLAKPLRAVKAAAPGPRVVTTVVRTAPAASGWDPLWLDPPGYMARKTLLGSPRELQAWLNNPSKVKAFFATPLIATVLNSPQSVGQLAGSAAMVSAFIASPAMQDRATVQALAGSSFMGELLARPGVKAVQADASVRGNLLTQPATADWLTKNPEMMRLLSGRR